MHRISSRYHVPKGRPSKRKMQALLKAKKRWASGEIELEHQSLHVWENDPDASGNVSSNYENNEVNTYPLNSSELNAATERKLSLLSSHTSAEHVISEQNDPTYVLVDTNVWKNLLSTVKCPECDMNNLNIIKTTQLVLPNIPSFTLISEGPGLLRVTIFPSPQDILPLTGYKIQWKQNESSWKHAREYLKSTGNELLIQDLEFDTDYAFRVSARNEIGFSNFSKVLVQKTEGLVAENTVHDSKVILSTVNKSPPSRQKVFWSTPYIVIILTWIFVHPSMI
ncbi:hemicentin-1 [Trichonephila clavata]|uniref:Hemicentin-1 n=2 Tax=Trichonephila clavata TaxID=2740835 RepID=A0A8X6M4Z2_TRICU|nr:hemicentin-1 [Trichonephila clavata]